jgi:Cys-tRNA(Pro)/Cys-tRNA(Cys) deacylase
MSSKNIKTNVARFLQKKGVKFDLIPYEVDENDLGAEHVAESLSENVEQVFKTIVLHGDKSGYIVGVLPGNHEIDLKKLAKVSGNKKCEPLPLKDLLPTTGYIRGGCSPIGMKKKFQTYIHTTVNSFPYVFVSAGVRGVQLKISPVDLIEQTEAVVADIVFEEKNESII